MAGVPSVRSGGDVAGVAVLYAVARDAQSRLKPNALSRARGASRAPRSRPPHSAKASCGCDVRNSGSVSAGSPRLSITARMSAAAPSTRCRQRQQSAYSVPCACRALNAEAPHVHDEVRHRAAVRPQWYRLRRTALARQTGRAARRGPTRRIRHNAFDASKLSRARLFCRVARQSCRKHVRIRLMFWVNRK